MKLIHLSDLHLGKQVNAFFMLEDQRYILEQILGIIDTEQPDGVLIAGDVYDKSIPSAAAIELCDWFLVELVRRSQQVFLCSGNHDSAERLSFGSRLMEASGVHISPVYDGTSTPVTMTDEFGTVNIFMLPFVKPATVHRFFPEAAPETYTDAVAAAIGSMNIDTAVRNILVAHQFVTGADTCESEEFVGNAGNVDAEVFDGFDYVALGHLHGPQNVGGRPNIRYCGTPLKYSFSEANHEKSVTVVELGQKGDLNLRMIPLIPKRDLVELRGTYRELTDKSFWDGTSYPEDYVHITLTDEDELPDIIGKLRFTYPYLMKFEYDNRRTRKNQTILADQQIKTKSPLEAFSDLYTLQNNRPLTAEQEAFMSSLIESIWEEEV